MRQLPGSLAPGFPSAQQHHDIDAGSPDNWRQVTRTRWIELYFSGSDLLHPKKLSSNHCDMPRRKYPWGTASTAKCLYFQNFYAPQKRVNPEKIASNCFFAVIAVVNCFF